MVRILSLQLNDCDAGAQADLRVVLYVFEGVAPILGVFLVGELLPVECVNCHAPYPFLSILSFA